MLKQERVRLTQMFDVVFGRRKFIKKIMWVCQS